MKLDEWWRSQLSFNWNHSKPDRWCNQRFRCWRNIYSCQPAPFFSSKSKKFHKFIKINNRLHGIERSKTRNFFTNCFRIRDLINSKFIKCVDKTKLEALLINGQFRKCQPVKLTTRTLHSTVVSNIDRQTITIRLADWLTDTDLAKAKRKDNSWKSRWDAQIAITNYNISVVQH